MAAEAPELRPGGETVITRLADILVIQAPAHGWIFSCLSSIPMNCSIRRARVSAFFAV
jgi:hypothetical protein